MKYTPIMTRKVMVVELRKPIYHSTYAIWDKWLKKAGNRKLVVKTPLGKATFNSVNEYKRKAKRIKRFYKNPDEPMIFYSLSFKPEIDRRDERKKKEALKEKSIPSSIMANPKMQEALERIKSL